MSQTTGLKRIVWSIDALLGDRTLLKKTESALAALTDGSKIEIEPVYILSPDELAVSTNLTPPWVKQFRPAAEKALDDFVKKLKVKNLRKPQVIIQSQPGIRKSVDALVLHAKSSGADLIAVSTNARKGVSRLILGSFAETLLLHSAVPVFIVNPNSPETKKIKNVLFPTDLEASSRGLFEQITALCKTLEADLRIYHKIPNPVEPLVASGAYLLGGTWVPVNTYFDKTTELREKEAEKWVSEAKAKGVNAEYFVDSKPGSVSQAVLSDAKKHKIDLIAMASQSGSFASALLGSISRQIIRQAHCPIWILHPNAKVSKSGKKTKTTSKSGMTLYG